MPPLLLHQQPERSFPQEIFRFKDTMGVLYVFYTKLGEDEGNESDSTQHESYSRSEATDLTFTL